MRRRGRDGWERLSPPGPTCWGKFRHVASGFEVHHCGHPTANWPYLILAPKVPAALVSFNGLGFESLVAAQATAERLASGDLRLVRRAGVPRVPVMANGEAPPR